MNDGNAIDALAAKLRATRAQLHKLMREQGRRWKDPESIIEALVTERDELRADAERYRLLRARMRHVRCGPHAGWTIEELLPGSDPDSAVDATRKK